MYILLVCGLKTLTESLNFKFFLLQLADRFSFQGYEIL